MSSAALVEALDDVRGRPYALFQDKLDASCQLATHRTPARVAKSLSSVERLVARNCLNSSAIQDFTRSQDEVECNSEFHYLLSYLIFTETSSVASRLSLHVVYGLEGLQSALTGNKGSLRRSRTNRN